jgi:hypothetical protein
VKASSRTLVSSSTTRIKARGVLKGVDGKLKPLDGVLGCEWAYGMSGILTENIKEKKHGYDRKRSKERGFFLEWMIFSLVPCFYRQPRRSLSFAFYFSFQNQKKMVLTDVVSQRRRKKKFKKEHGESPFFCHS